jgi:histidinol dehydrogenase
MADFNLRITRIDSRKDDVQQSLDALRARLSPQGDVVSEAGRRLTIEVFGEPLRPPEVVERICADVRDRGIEALLAYCRKLDKADLTARTLRVATDELAAAHAAADGEFLATVQRIRDNILRFQRVLLPGDVRLDLPHGGYLAQRYLPVRRAGLCVPGGAAAYPSTVLMTAVPAQAAGVEQLAVVAPPTPFGAYNQDLLAVCHELGIQEVYRMGGAQAVAALAYGVEGIEPVDIIVGPGNLFVALAKKYVYGEVDIDSIAGPSEVVVVADGTARPDFTALDMFAQAEHSPGASILVTWEEGVIESTYREIAARVGQLERSDLTVQSLEAFGAMILTRDADEACRIANLIAPEHLHIAAENAEQLLAKIPNAGAAFLGNHTPVAVGDYAAGPSHVLPTGGTARWASGLSATDFIRSGSVLHFTEAELRNIAPDVQRMADKEGLTAHRGSVDIRLE